MTTITPLQQQVIDRVAQCFAIIQEAYPDMVATLPAVEFDIKSKDAGVAYPKRNEVSFNNTLLIENAEEFIENTVAHEVAHIIDHILHDTFRVRFNRTTGKRLPVQVHGKTWKHIMCLLGVSPNRVHYYDTSNVGRKRKRHNYQCTQCNHVIPVSTRKHNSMVNSGASYVHKACQASLVFIGTTII